MRARLSICALAACGLIAAPSASAAGCPNEALREAQGATALPSCMALEMVSPPKKNSEPAFSPSFSVDGARVLFVAQAALAGTPGYQAFAGDRYVATHTARGWQLAPTSPPPGAEIVSGGRRFGGAATFTPDLSRWNLVGATRYQTFLGLFRLFGGGLDGSLTPVSPLMVPIDNSGRNDVQESVGADLSGSSADLETSVLRGVFAHIAYLPDDPKPPPGTPLEAVPGKDRNSYVTTIEEGGPTLELLARDKDGPVYGGRCGAHLGGPLNIAGHPTFNQGALSASGERIFLSTRPAQPFDSGTAEGPICDIANPIRVLVRNATPGGTEIEPLLPGGLVEWQQPGDDLFQAASADGTKVYFATPRKLTASDTDAGAQPCEDTLGASQGCDLYLYDSAKPEGSRLTQVSAGDGPSPADVLTAVTAISGNGSRAYFVAQGVLTPDTSPSGTTAELGEPNLYAYDADSGQLAFIGVLAEEDKEELWGAEGSFFGGAFSVPLYGPGGPADEIGGDGHTLAFASKAPLTTDDADGGYRDVFRYDADTDALERISKAAPGGSDNGPFDVAVNPNPALDPDSNFGEQKRWAGEDGQSIAFATEEALALVDSDGENNPYIWRPGLLGFVAAKVENAPAVAPDGTQIAFSTRTVLLPQDGDTAEDVYAAREGGGFPFPVEPPEPCDPLLEGGCQGPASSPPALGIPSAVNASSGNVRRSPGCRRGFVKKKGRCAKKKTRQHKGKKQAGKKPKAGQ